jgi:WD40 repeat protein/tRNA A-37 threonylcarbamoyl transferase component Bud32
VPTVDLSNHALGPMGDPTQGLVLPATAEPALAGDVTVIGEYDLLGEVARGGMGVVYKARHRKLNRVVALKVHRAGRLVSADEALRFQIEAEAAAKLDHPSIVPIYEVGQLAGMPYFSMAFVEGQSLARRVAVQPLAPREAAGLIRQVAEAVAYAHAQGVIHRDLKPGNILMDAAGQPRVTDFGLAKRADADSSLTQAGQVMGTPSYMPPEQAEGKNDQVGPLSDVYALGATLYCLVTGRPPFQSANVVDTLKQVVEREPVAPSFINAAIDRDLDTICLKCLQKRPEKRYASATALAEDLQRYLDRRPILARPVGNVEKLLRWCRRNPLVAASLAGIAGVFVTAFVLVSWSYVRAEGARQLAEQREEAERWERYRANLLAAGTAMQLHNVSTAKIALNAAPEEHRNWEWHYLTHQLDTARQVLHVGEGIREIALSPDGLIAAAQSARGPAQLWDLVTRQEVAELPNRSPVTVFEFSADGKSLAYVVADQNNLFLWDLARGRPGAVLSGAEQPVVSMHFSPNGQRLVAEFRDRTVRVWDTATGEQRLVLHGHQDASQDVRFSPDGRRIVSAARDRTLRLWDADTGQALAILRDNEREVAKAIFNPQGDRIVSAEHYPSNALRLRDAATGKSLAVLRGHTNVAGELAFSRDGTRLASGGLDQTIRLWDGRTGQALWSREGHRGHVREMLFSPDGKYLISASVDQTARLWDVATGAPLGVLHGHTGSIQHVQYTRDGSTIVTASLDGTVRLWDARTAERSGALRGHESFVYSVAFHPDGERVASASWDGSVGIWDATTGKRLAQWDYLAKLPDDEKVITSVAFQPDGQAIATYGRHDGVRLWDVTTGKELHHFDGPRDRDTRLAFSTRGELLACGGTDHDVHVWDVPRRVTVAVLRGQRAMDLAFSPDDAWLAAAGTDRTIRIWRVGTQEPIQVLEGHTDHVYTVAVSRDGKRLASGSVDGTVRLWDTATWREAAVLRHGTNVYGVAFSADGSRLASACADNLIRFWDLKTHQLVAELDGHTAYVHHLAFSPDGTRLVSGSGDHTVRVWDTLSVQERVQRAPRP